MAATAEQLHIEYFEDIDFEDVVGQETWRPLVLNVAELEGEQAIREQSMRFIGSVALGEGVVTEEVRQAKSWTLQDAIQEAARGDSEARRMTEMNVRTDVVERTLKAGHIIEVPMEIGERGEVRQYGQSAAEIQANSLRFATADRRMRARTEAETRNMFRIQEALDRGLLEEYNFVVFSRAADDMDESDMDKVGFFTDTMSCAIQSTSLEAGQMQVESAFVAGKTSLNSPRHDQATMAKVGVQLGVDLRRKTATELLDTPLLIHKSVMPEGVVDLVQLYDEAAGGTFFGQDKPRIDYSDYRQQCAARERSFQPKIDLIVEELIDAAPTIVSPVHATKLLHKISEARMVEHAVLDTSIDPRVFGGVSAGHIVNARKFIELGQVDLALDEVSRAKSTAKSSSCPSGVSGAEGSDGEGGEGSSGPGEDQFGSLQFNCPKCKRTNMRTRGKLLPRCQHCKADVTCG
jgi:hypothetical protein